MILFALTLTSAMIAPGPQFLALFPRAQFPEPGQSLVINSTDIRPTAPFREVIPSWNVKNPERAQVIVEIRAHIAGKPSKWYRMADWALSAAGTRQSTNDQEDASGDVLTDTLSLKSAAEALDVRVTLSTLPGDGPLPELEMIGLSFAGKDKEPNDTAAKSEAWGKTVEVPQRAQGNYPRGNVLCSPTSMSMMLWHYSNALEAPSMNQDVPEVEAKVWDPVYKGAGNWSFNTAYVGSFPKMRSYVARFCSISDLERWVIAGLPVVCSVSFDMIRGLPLSPTESGHLVVLVGFTSDGDPVFNDPARKNQVRYVYKRADFEKAWLYSKRTVYVVHPIGAKLPKPSNGLWLSSGS